MYQLPLAQLEFKQNNSVQLHFLLNVAVNVLALWSSVFSVQHLAYLIVFLLITKKNDILSILCLPKVDPHQSIEKIEKRKHHRKKFPQHKSVLCLISDLVPHEQKDKSYQKNVQPHCQPVRKHNQLQLKLSGQIISNHKEVA